MRQLTELEMLLVSGGQSSSDSGTEIVVTGPGGGTSPPDSAGGSGAGGDHPGGGNDGSDKDGSDVYDFNVTATDANDTANMQLALNYLQDSSKAKELLNWAADNGVTIHIVHNGVDESNAKTKEIWWDPNSAIKTSDGSYQSAALGLIHELAHVYGDDTTANAEHYLPSDPLYGYGTNFEYNAINNWETPVAVELGEAVRLNHDGTSTPAPDSIHLPG